MKTNGGSRRHGRSLKIYLLVFVFIVLFPWHRRSWFAAHRGPRVPLGAAHTQAPFAPNRNADAAPENCAQHKNFMRHGGLATIKQLLQLVDGAAQRFSKRVLHQDVLPQLHVLGQLLVVDVHLLS